MRTNRLVVAALLAVGFGLVLSWSLSLGSGPARAAAIGVDTLNDGVFVDGNCTLREAIIAANTDTAVDACPAGSGADTITLTVAGTYALTATGTGEDAAYTGDLDITDALTIVGLGADQTIIDASGLISDRVLHVQAAASTVVISGVTVVGGDGVDLGGGIRCVLADLDLINASISDNVAANMGGGIYVQGGNVSLTGGEVLSNTADHGGGLFLFSGSATLHGGDVFSNVATSSGGGVYVSNAGATFTATGDSRIAYNVAGSGGELIVNLGAVLLDGGQILSNTVTGNGGGLHVSQGSAMVSGTHITSNTAGSSGGGVYLYQASSAYTQTGDTVVAHNAAEGTAPNMGGGGLYINRGLATLLAGEVRDNSAASTVSSSGGGGVHVRYPEAALLLAGGRIVRNTAVRGGGVYIYDGDATLRAGSIISNMASSRGGGVHLQYGTAAISGGLIRGNEATDYGGGVYILSGAAMLSGGEIVSNSAGYGGGVYVSSSSATLTQTAPCVIARNSADVRGGGILVAGGSATLSRASIISNTASRGGGMYVNSGRVHLDRGFIITNSAGYGAGIYNSDGTVAMINATVSGNRATSSGGGGIWNDNGANELSYTTVASNTAGSTGGGIRNAGSGVFTVTDTLLAHNSPDNCSAGGLTSTGHNLDDGTSCALAAAGDISDTVPLLGPLTYDAGTWVHPLLDGSPAIEAGDCVAGIATDQRGVARPEGATCDIGAYEWEWEKVYLTLVLRGF